MLSESHTYLFETTPFWGILAREPAESCVYRGRHTRSAEAAPVRIRPKKGLRSGARETNLLEVDMRRDVGVVLSGGGVNGVLMELGFLKRLRESLLWPRIGYIFGTSSGALSGVMAALDRVDELERFLLALRPEQTFRPHRLWRLPFLGLHDYELPRTVEAWFGDLTALAEELARSPIELVVLATDLTDQHHNTPTNYELAYSSRTTPPAEMAQAVLASGAISALVMPLRVGDRIATDGAWVRNFPLGHAFDHDDVELIVSFRYIPKYPRLGTEGLQHLRHRLERFGRIPPIRAFISELDDAEQRALRGEPAHLADMMVRLARVAVLRNTKLEEKYADEKDQSLRELRSLRHDVLAAVGDEQTRAVLAERFASARFPFRHDRLVPRITIRGTIEGTGLEPGFRAQPEWTVEAKQELIDRGWSLADEHLREIEPPVAEARVSGIR
jgi:predicted acylesterase/phospholipase RssA